MSRIDDIRGNIRIYDNRVAERDVMYLLKRVEALEAAIAAYRRWFDTCSRTLAPDWERKACDASIALDAALENADA
jgi:hypothetical protein